MRRSIVPKGFEHCSHSIFHNYSNPLLPPINLDDNELDDNIEKEKSDHNNTCPICLQEVLDPVTLVSCHHYFCIDCIVKWFQTKLACPLCKTNSSYFIQSNSGSHGQFNLWKIAPNINENEVKHTLGTSSSLPGLQMAIRAHRSNVLLRNFIIPLNYPNDDSSSTIIINEDNRADLIKLSSTAKRNNDVSLPHSDDMNVDIGLSDDLGMICAELKRLEDELKADYDTEENNP
jgi:hypothetical protein